MANIIRAESLTLPEATIYAAELVEHGRARTAAALLRRTFRAAPDTDAAEFLRAAITLDSGLKVGLPMLRANYRRARRTGDHTAANIVCAVAIAARNADRADEHPDAPDRITADAAATDLLRYDAAPGDNGYSTHSTPRTQRAPRYAPGEARRTAPRNDYKETNPSTVRDDAHHNHPLNGFRANGTRRRIFRPATCPVCRRAKQVQRQQDTWTDYAAENHHTADIAARVNAPTRDDEETQGTATAEIPCVDCGRPRPMQPEDTDTGQCPACTELTTTEPTARTWTPGHKARPSAHAAHDEQQATARRRRYNKRPRPSKFCDIEGHEAYRCTLTGPHDQADAIKAWCNTTVERYADEPARALINSMWHAGTTAERDTITAWATFSPSSPKRAARRRPSVAPVSIAA